MQPNFQSTKYEFLRRERGLKLCPFGTDFTNKQSTAAGLAGSCIRDRTVVAEIRSGGTMKAARGHCKGNWQQEQVATQPSNISVALN